MKQSFFGFQRTFSSLFIRRPVNQNNILFRALGATFFSYLNFRYFNSFNNDGKSKKDFDMKPQAPSPNF